MKVVITSMRNEAEYILEWVAWNIHIGFDKIIIFTNNNDDNSIDILKKLKKTGYVDYFELSPPPNSRPQMYAFNKGLEWCHENKPSWVMCIDADEYLFLKNNKNISDYLNSMPEDTDAIAFNWKIFGSGDIKDKGIGTTIERFLMRANDSYPIHSQFKSIFRYHEDIVRFHHRAFYKRGIENTKYLYSDGKELTNNAKKAGFSKSDNYITFRDAQLNHYTTRSLAELHMKMQRGNGFDPTLEKNPRVIEYKRKFDKNHVYEANILNHLPGYLKVLKSLNIEVNSNVS